MGQLLLFVRKLAEHQEVNFEQPLESLLLLGLVVAAVVPFFLVPTNLPIEEAVPTKIK